MQFKQICLFFVLSSKCYVHLFGRSANLSFSYKYAAGGKHRAAAGKHGADGGEVTSPADRYYQVEKILKTETRRGKPYYFVQWRGWPASFNSWVPGTDIKRI